MIEPDDFARRFSQRAGRLMWFLGAGASAAAGIPAALDMVWEFKQQLYVSQRRVSEKSVADLSNPAVRAQLQSHIDATGKYPPNGAPDEYASLFEAVWSSEADRRSYLDSKVAGAKPSYGHLALATLMRASLTKLVWTTNFDPLVADACAKVFDGTGALSSVALDAPALAGDLVGTERWPIEIKLHGDFRSRRLKNTTDELRQQDARLRQLMLDCCGRFGLVVTGYSGRDQSVMDTLMSAVRREDTFPGGLFWLHRGEGPPLEIVTELLEAAADAGIDGGLVRIENFDEALRDLVRLTRGLDTTALDAFASERRRWTAAPRPTGQASWPIVRLNAIPVVHTPSVCRRVVCSIGGFSEVREAVKSAGSDIICARVRAGVLSFGEDAAVEATFQQFRITEFDLHPIEAHRLRNDTGERGLLRSALSRAFTRHHALDCIRHHATDHMVPSDQDDPRWDDLRRIVGTLRGSVPGCPELTWREGVAIRLDWANDHLWVLFEPRTVFDGITDSNRAVAADFGRERSVKRYNRVLNDLVEFWSGMLAGEGTALRALNCSSGVDAVFRLSRQTAYSRRVRP